MPADMGTSGGETADQPSGWTIDTLAAHVSSMFREADRRYEQRFVAQEKAVADALAAQDKAVQTALMAAKEAVGKAEAATEKRFDAVNEFRAQLNDQAGRLMTRDESLSRHNRTAEQIAELQARIDSDNRVARERCDNDVKTLRDRHDQDMGVVNSRLDTAQGARQGLQQGWGMLLAAVGLAGAVIGILAAVN